MDYKGLPFKKATNKEILFSELLMVIKFQSLNFSSSEKTG